MIVKRYQPICDRCGTEGPLIYSDNLAYATEQITSMSWHITDEGWTFCEDCRAAMDGEKQLQ